MLRHRFSFLHMVLWLVPLTAIAADGNRLTYLDELNLYYPHRNFPKLVTPQWVGEPGVEAVVILAIDDMREHGKYEQFLRPILNRLKRIDGRAAVSIMTNRIDPNEPHLQQWLKEGVSLETHTFDHPCPLLQGGDFAKAKGTYDRCVDLLASVPNSKPVAFRMPCCDSLNTPSPRFYAEIFNKVTDKTNFLTIDTSVFNIFTSNDPDLPRGLVLDPDGQDKFRKYVPYDRSFVNTIEDYPYPYVIGKLCWQFPCVTPSDWQAQHLHKPNNPITVSDWKAALDCTVIKQGVFCLVFHPHGWIKSEQIVELIDHAVEKHGKKVKFLTFREAQQRIDKYLLGGVPIRDPKTGQDNGVRVLDVNNDGYMDVVIGNEKVQQTLIWSSRRKDWVVGDFPVKLVAAKGEDAGVRFGTIGNRTMFLVRNEITAGAWLFDPANGKPWFKSGMTEGLDRYGVYTHRKGRDGGVRLRDLCGRGTPQLLVANNEQRFVLNWSGHNQIWVKWEISFPAAIATADGGDNGLRFVDIDEDGFDDVVFSNEREYGLYLFADIKTGWSRKVLEGKREPHGSQSVGLPLIARNGQNMGFFVHSRHLWWQNEHTHLLPNLVDRRSFNQILAQVEPEPKSPEASLKSIQPRPGFTVELMAAEPLVMDPIFMTWGPDGKMWVVEMGDYPLGIDGKGKPGGKIKFLESTRGDGKYDKATLFLDNVPFPTSLLPWRRGVIVTAAPDIFYAEDTDGDGKADKRVSLYVGFREGNQQHRVNSLVWGLDNWVYCANGDSGGTIKYVGPANKSASSGRPFPEVNIGSRDLRIRPDTGEIDLQAGQTQYGRARDDWGNWFGNNNVNPMWHFALTDHYIRRNPFIAAPDPRVQISITPGAAPVYPISRTLPRPNNPQSANHFTSACSAIVYRDDLFGPHFENNTFVSEPVHNLIHREIMRPDGTTFRSQRAIDEQKSEFLASSDNWFRPCSITTGPDGSLWVADMYRHVIEHPEWIPKAWQDRLDLRAGRDKGRIYRVYPVGVQPRPIPRLDKLDTAGLVAALDSPSGWQRDMAQMMLLWKNDPSAVPLLEKMVRESPRPLARLHALCTLDGLVSLKTEVLVAALGDSHPGVRRHAVRLCVESSGGSEVLHPPLTPLGEAMLKRIDDPDPQVQMQLAYALGEWKDPRAGKALGEMALKSSDRYMSAAVMSSVNRDNLDRVLLVVLGSKEKRPAALVENLLRMASAAGNTRALVPLLEAVADPGGKTANYAPWQLTALAGLLDALDQRNTPLQKLHADGGAELRSALQKLSGVFAAARTTVSDPKASSDDRLLAVRLIGRGLDRQADDLKLLAGLLSPQNADDVQTAAVTALGKLRSPQVPEALLAGWKAYGPTRRGQVLDILLTREDWLKSTLDAIDQKQILASELDPGRRQRMLEHKSTAIRQRAARVFAGAIAPDRQKVVDEYQAVLKLAGDPARGAQLFGKHCAGCHKLGEVGHIVGPDLASVGDRSPQGLLVAVLDPNRVVESRYVNYTALTKNGQTLTGILASETGNSITLLAQEGKQHVILRTDLEELFSTGKSPMPEGLEKEIKHQDMADLIAFVGSAVPQVKPKVFPGNQPEIVRPGKDGALFLTAKNAEIYGKTLVLESKHGNLGYWNSDDDHAIWTVEVAKAGRYSITLNWACADASAGKPYLLLAGGNSFTGKVGGTGSWDNYRQERVGDIVLPAGTLRLTFKPGRNLASSSLIDLRSIRLVPAE